MYHFLKANTIASQHTKVARQILPANGNLSCQAPIKQDWLVLKIVNTTGASALAALFDASGKFELKDGIQTQDGVTIESTNTSYEAFLNDLASGEQYSTNLTRAAVNAGKEVQFENSWLLKADVRFSKGNSLLDEIIPSTYLDPMQQQANRVDVLDPYTITRQRIMEIVIEPLTTLILRIKINKALENG